MGQVENIHRQLPKASFWPLTTEHQARFAHRAGAVEDIAFLSLEHAFAENPLATTYNKILRLSHPNHG